MIFVSLPQSDIAPDRVLSTMQRAVLEQSDEDIKPMDLLLVNYTSDRYVRSPVSMKVK